MSNEYNITILERAAEMIDYWTDKLPAQKIEQAIGTNDLDLVRQFTLEAEALASQEEMHGADLL